MGDSQLFRMPLFYVPSPPFPNLRAALRQTPQITVKRPGPASPVPVWVRQHGAAVGALNFE
jgi:hypothetical protein